jgi:carboxynorspermidine decarboxylase
MPCFDGAQRFLDVLDVSTLIKKYLSGSEASSVNEARLGYKEFGKETHVFSPSYTEKNIREYIKYADHLSFQFISHSGINSKISARGKFLVE